MRAQCIALLVYVTLLLLFTQAFPCAQVSVEGAFNFEQALLKHEYVYLGMAPHAAGGGSQGPHKPHSQCP